MTGGIICPAGGCGGLDRTGKLGTVAGLFHKRDGVHAVEVTFAVELAGGSCPKAAR